MTTFKELPNGTSFYKQGVTKLFKKIVILGGEHIINAAFNHDTNVVVLMRPDTEVIKAEEVVYVVTIYKDIFYDVGGYEYNMQEKDIVYIGHSQRKAHEMLTKVKTDPEPFLKSAEKFLSVHLYKEKLQ